MKLKQWLKREKKTVADMANDLEITHCVARCWAVGDRMPTIENMQKIFAYTGGEVTPNDFYNINETEKELNHE